MKKTILIIIGILIILIILGIWAYLFMYGAPKNSAEVFARFGLGGDTTEPQIIPEGTVDVTPETTTGAPQKLRQLTTKPVAGAVFTADGVRYVEQGTGHVYDIHLLSGEESLVEGTTIPQATNAIFSHDGRYVAITTLDRNGIKTILEEISTNGSTTKDGVALPLGATNIAFGTASGTLQYLLPQPTGSAGYSYNIKKDQSTLVFKIPLRDVRVIWDTPTYVYTIPTAYQVGHLYTIAKNDLVYVREGSEALMALIYGARIITTSGAGESIASKIRTGAGALKSSPIPLIPEKCVLNRNATSTYYCGVPSNIADGTFPDDWYKGSIAYNDILWKVNMDEVSATALSNPLLESGREIDVLKIGTNVQGTYIYMINKNDNTLWMFDTTL